MIGGIILLLGILLVWVGGTNRGQAMWKAIFGEAFKPIGFGSQSMARGQVLNIPNQTGLLITTLSREEKASLSLLNPNDGVCYVKINGFAGNAPPNWDWKVPSQSYCQLPGPWDSLGIYYLDQSGSGRSAEINVYELDSQIGVPSFIAIGRAVQMAGSTMDITQGNQPSNPPLGTSRLWVDGQGNLQLLNPDGTNVHQVDTNDALGGILSGSLLNPIGNVNANAGFGTMRAMANSFFPTGEGLELIYDPSNHVGYIYSYDRSAGIWHDLVVSAHSITLALQSGGGLGLPPSCVGSNQIVDGSIVSADIAGNTIQNGNILGGTLTYDKMVANAISSQTQNSPGAFSTTSASYIGSPLAVSYNCVGGMTLLFATASFGWYNTAISTANYFFLGFDGGAWAGSQYVTNANASYGHMMTLTAFMVNPAAGAHTAQLYYATNGGTLNVSPSSIGIFGLNR